MIAFTEYDLRIKKLIQFKELLKVYFSSSTTEEQNKNREKVALLIAEISNYIRSSGVPSHTHITRANIVYTQQGDIDFYSNIFNLDEFGISYQSVFDNLNMSIGAYRYLKRQFIRKLTNPIYWVISLVSIPIYIARKSGIDTTSFENSITGKIYTFVSSLIITVASLFYLLDLFGFLGNQK